jgi:hypothetical protein
MPRSHHEADKIFLRKVEYSEMGLTVIRSVSFPAPAFSEGGVECHNNTEYCVQSPTLFRYYFEWKASKPRKVDVMGSNYHRGDSLAKTTDQAHTPEFMPSKPDQALIKDEPEVGCKQGG